MAMDVMYYGCGKYTDAFAADVNSFTEDTFNRLLPELSPARQKRVNSFRFMKDKMLSFGAGLLVDDFLFRNYGIRERDVFGYDKEGKPCLKGFSEVKISLSHSGGIALAAFSRKGAVGCDIEQETDDDGRIISDLSEHFFTDKERAEIRCREDFFRVWTKKEAVFKFGSDNYFIKEYKFENYFIAICGENYGY
jgi:4'-phosphopantetheinyl transferase